MSRRIRDHKQAPMRNGDSGINPLVFLEMGEQATWEREPVTPFRALTGDPRNETATLEPDVREFNALVTAAATEAREAHTAFDTLRTALAGTPDALNPESDAFKAADSAREAYQEASQKHAALLAGREQLLGMAFPGGQRPEGNGPEPGAALSASSTRELSRRVSAGEVALQSETYKELKASGAFTVNERKSVDAVLLRRVEGGQQRLADTIRTGRSAASAASLITGSDESSAGALIEPQHQPGIVGIPPRELRLVDMITVGTTDSDAVDFVVELGGTNNAAEVAEATAVSGTSGTKPLSSILLEKRKFDVVTIAHAIAATKRSLADAGQLRTLIEQFLSQGLDDRLDDQIAAGNGQGENIRGIANTLGLAQVSQRKAVAGNTDIPEIALSTIFRAITVVRKSRYIATAIGMNPDDWAELVLWRTGKGAVANQVGTAGSYAEGAYFLGGPIDIPNKRIWGRPVIESEAFPVGGPIVGDFRKAAIWLREGIQVLASDSHEDFFLRNMVAILAEMRAAFGVIAIAAFCQADIS